MDGLMSTHNIVFGRVLMNLECHKSWTSVNSLPNNKVLDWSKLKAFADNKMLKQCGKKC